jgi:hypothetical protein
LLKDYKEGNASSDSGQAQPSEENKESRKIASLSKRTNNKKKSFL